MERPSYRRTYKAIKVYRPVGRQYASNPRALSAIRLMVQKWCSEKYAWGHSTYDAVIEKVNCEFVVRAVALCSKSVQASSRGSGIARPTAKWYTTCRGRVRGSLRGEAPSSFFRNCEGPERCSSPDWEITGAGSRQSWSCAATRLEGEPSITSAACSAVQGAATTGASPSSRKPRYRCTSSS